MTLSYNGKAFVGGDIEDVPYDSQYPPKIKDEKLTFNYKEDIYVLINYYDVEHGFDISVTLENLNGDISYTIPGEIPDPYDWDPPIFYNWISVSGRFYNFQPDDYKIIIKENGSIRETIYDIKITIPECDDTCDKYTTETIHNIWDNDSLICRESSREIIIGKCNATVSTLTCSTESTGVVATGYDGCTLLNYYDSDSDGIIDANDINIIITEYNSHKMAYDEYNYLLDCYYNHGGNINSKCQECINIPCNLPDPDFLLATK